MQVPRIEASLFNKPLLATPGQLESVLDYLGTRNAGRDLSTFNVEHIQKKPPKFDAKSKTGYLKVEGPLNYRPTLLNALCGMTSYQQLERDFRMFLDQGAKRLVMTFDSGGGEAYGSLETACLLRSLADANGVRILAYCDGLIASAAYALGCVAHEVYLNPESECGSVGVVVKLRNSNEAMQKMGVKDTYVYAGDSKIPFAKSGDWSKDFLTDLQAKVGGVYNQFVAHVSKYRGMSPQAVIDTKAKVFTAQKAIEIGLADSLLTREQFQEYLATGKKPTPAPTIPLTPTPFWKRSKPKADGVSLSIQRLAQKRLNGGFDLRRLDRIASVSRTFTEADYLLQQTRNMTEEQFESRIKSLAR